MKFEIYLIADISTAYLPDSDLELIQDYVRFDAAGGKVEGLEHAV